MDITCRNRSMPRDSFLSIYKVIAFSRYQGTHLLYGMDAKKSIFTSPAGEAESGLERLHQCAEKELLQFVSAEGPSKEFNDFRTKLAGLTR